MARICRLFSPSILALILCSAVQAQAPGAAGVFGAGGSPAPVVGGQGGAGPVRLQSAPSAGSSQAAQVQFMQAGQVAAQAGAIPGAGQAGVPGLAPGAMADPAQGGALPASTRLGDLSPTAARPGLPPEPPSEFQRFVEQTTGQMLPIYGMALFAAGRFEPVQATQVPDGYVVGPGDELIVQVYGAVDFADRLVVDRDGRVLIPRVGPVKVAGLRFREVEGHLSRSVGEVYRNFRLSVSMGRLRSIEVYLLGQARAPGRKVVGSLSTLINALFETGGPSARGSMRAIELRRAGRVVTRIDLYDFIAQGDSSADRPLEPGDIIYVPPAGPQVALAGSVNEPAIYELPRAGGSIESVLALTGGLPTLAAPQKAQLERVDAKAQPARFVQDLTLDAAGLATSLRGGDIVTVFQISPQFANAVTLQGSVAAPMRYAFRQGMRISDLVGNNNFLVPVSYWLRLNSGAAIPGLDRPEVNLDYATIQRLDPIRLRTETIPFNLAKALLGQPQENLTLKAGDIVRVYSATEPGADAFDSIALQASFVDGLKRFSWREGHRVTDVIPDLAWLREQVTRWVRT
ncbi:MAG: hypothetical protein FJY25_18235, partial [Betaproteobacteria bacterium]|nr:hypothetical protein [Betaproteobacteria bacterium]